MPNPDNRYSLRERERYSNDPRDERYPSSRGQDYYADQRRDYESREPYGFDDRSERMRGGLYEGQDWQDRYPVDRARDDDFRRGYPDSFGMRDNYSRDYRDDYTSRQMGARGMGAAYERPEAGYGAKLATGPHRGKGPKGYSRSDDRIREDVSDALM